MNKKVQGITRGEINFWYPIVILLVAVVMWGVRLEGRVSANDDEAHDKGSILRADFEKSNEILIDVHNRVIRMEKDIEFIRLDIEGR